MSIFSELRIYVQASNANIFWYLVIIGLLLDLEGSGSDTEECDASVCKYGGMCQINQEGKSECVCDFQCENIRWIWWIVFIVLWKFYTSICNCMIGQK